MFLLLSLVLNVMLPSRALVLKKFWLIKCWLIFGLVFLVGCQRAPLTAPVQSTESLTLPNAAQAWLAFSKNAMSITGDIVLTSSQITFQNGETLAIRPIEKDDDLGLVLYQVTSKSNPTLLYGNTICGNTPVDYLTVNTYSTDSSRAELSDMSLTAYRYPEVLRIRDLPLRDKNDIHRSLCAIYNYMVPPTPDASGVRR